MTENPVHDVYVSYSAADRSEVNYLVYNLKSRGLGVWDVGQVHPGAEVQEEVKRAFGQSRMALVIIGKTGIDEDQLKEISNLIGIRAAGGKYPVIPVILPGAEKVTIPEFLRRKKALVFPNIVSDPNRLSEMVSSVRRLIGRPEQKVAASTTVQPDANQTTDSAPDDSSSMTIGELLDQPLVKRLRPDERRALRDAAEYCALQSLTLNSLWLLGAMLRRPKPKSSEEFFGNLLEKKQSDGSALLLPKDFFFYLSTTQPRRADSARVKVSPELNITLTIAATIADEVRNIRGKTSVRTDPVSTRYVLGAILSHDIQLQRSENSSVFHVSATAHLEDMSFDLDELRWSFLTYVRREENKGGSSLDVQAAKHLVWLKHIRMVPPESLWHRLLSFDLEVFKIGAINWELFTGEGKFPTRKTHDFFMLFVSPPPQSVSAEWNGDLGRYLAFIRRESAQDSRRLFKFDLSLPVGVRSVNVALKNLSLISDDTIFEDSQTPGEKAEGWKLILYLNPALVGELTAVFDEIDYVADESVSTNSENALKPPDTTGQQVVAPAISGGNQHDSQIVTTAQDRVDSVKPDAPLPPAIEKPADASTPSETSSNGKPVSTQPLAATSPTIINYVTTVLPPPAPAKNRVSLQISSSQVTLWHNGQPYAGENKLDKDLVADETSPQQYGEQLFKGIIHGEGDKSTLAGYTKAKQENNDGLTFELWIAEQDATLNAHKWEYLRDPADNLVPLFGLEKFPFYRRVHSTGKQAIHAKPLKILIAICNPTTLGRETDDQNNKINPNISKLVKIDVSQERAILEAALHRLKEANVARYEILDGAKESPVTLEAIREKLQDGYHILHLLSHGVLIGGAYYLVMEGNDRRHKLEPAERFKEIMKAQDHLRLVVLAACQSATRGTGVTLQGLGPAIVGDAIPAVIAMQDQVEVKTAQLFTQYFYDDLARTGRVDTAMSATRFALYQSNPKQWQWGIPVLFMSTADGKLLDVDKKANTKLPPLEPDVKTYDQLPGQGDPTPRKLAQAIEAEARRYGAVPETVGALRAVIAPTLAAASAGDDQLAQPQDRAALTRALPNRLALDANDLEKFVSSTGGKLELHPSVYRQIASALNAGKHLILIGPPGTGKTSLAHAVCQYAHSEGCAAGFIPTTATADWTAFDTIGGYVPTAQQVLQFRPGKFLEAICSGSWLVIDEINRAEIDKAFGELFTVLSGQGADLPYSVGNDLVRILPPAQDDPNDWVPEQGKGLSGYDYVMHPTWRILATMNVYDKSSLFGMSFAFMRRFAFIDVDLPATKTFEELVDRWAVERAIDFMNPEVVDMLTKLKGLLKPDNALSRRALGPAIVKDMMSYMGNRLQVGAHEKPIDVLGEAFLLYVTPQLDGLDRTSIAAIHTYLRKDVFTNSSILDLLHRRLRSLYPHMGEREWEA